MSEELDITSGIITVVQLAQKVIQYVLEVKEADHDRRHILNEITSAQSFLSLLKDKAECPGARSDAALFNTLKALNQPNGPLAQFKAALERIASKLKPLKGLKKGYKALAWPFEKGEINEILKGLERQKALFGLALQNDNL
jgi:hypothetical protein